MVSVIVVAEGASLASALRNNLRSLHKEWEISFAPSARDADKLIRENEYDLVLCDTMLNDMAAVDLLAAAANRHPEGIRLALSATPEADISLDCAHLAHHVLPRIADRSLIRDSYRRSAALREIAGSTPATRVLPAGSHWFKLPPLYSQVIDEAARPDGSIEHAANLVDMDHPVATALLKTLNSEFFAHSRNIGSVDQASYLLGFDLVRGVLLAQLFFAVAGKQERVLPVRRLVHHGQYAGSLARRIARLEKLNPKYADHALMAGTIQSAGMLILSQHDPERYQRVLGMVNDQGRSFEQAEQELFGCDHAAVGCRLLRGWGLPDNVVEAMAYQYAPDTCLNRNFSSLSAVYAANALVQDLKYPDGATPPETVNTRYLLKVASAPAIAEWKLHAGLPIQALD